MKHIFIINPAAGKGKENKRIGDAIGDACTAADVSFEIYTTIQSGDAIDFVRECIKNKPVSEVYRFYACGGDGTLCEVINGAANEKEVEVACIPIGTGNDFIRNFTHQDFFCDITKQLLGDAVSIDCYRLDSELYGINMVNIGFDCDVAVKASELKRRRFMPKALAYIAGVAVMLKKNKGCTVHVTREDGSELTRDFQLVSAANGGFCGGGFHSAPKSSLSDGLLDVSLIDKVTRRDFIRLVGSYKSGKHLETKLGKKIVEYHQAHRVTFEFTKPTNVCIDGEIRKKTRIELSVVPNALSFVIPVGCAVK